MKYSPISFKCTCYLFLLHYNSSNFVLTSNKFNGDIDIFIMTL
jgi:hypothetical protein